MRTPYKNFKKQKNYAKYMKSNKSQKIEDNNNYKIRKGCVIKMSCKYITEDNNNYKIKKRMCNQNELQVHNGAFQLPLR